MQCQQSQLCHGYRRGRSSECRRPHGGQAAQSASPATTSDPNLASRALTTRLEIDRADPENRPFKHPDPIGWTESHRGRILGALYAILLGNPELGSDRNAQAKTRFQGWWRMIGAAVEHAAALYGETLDFLSLFLEQEEEDEDSASLADALDAAAGAWP